jgi:recombinational DNA repair protein RecR
MDPHQNQFNPDFGFEDAKNHYWKVINDSRRRMDQFLDVIEESGIPDMITQCPECKCRTLKVSKTQNQNFCHICEAMIKNGKSHKNIFYRIYYYLKDLI